MKFVVILCILLLVGCAQKLIIEKNVVEEKPKEDIKMNLKSNAFTHEDIIPKKYTCQGEDINPSLKWDDVPEGTKSFALVIDDPDAPNGLWVHWIVKDIPFNQREISEDSVPGKEIPNSFKRDNYGGPCPPSGTHRYFFKLYALDVETLDAENAKDFYKEIDQHTIESAVLMGRYKKD